MMTAFHLVVLLWAWPAAPTEPPSSNIDPTHRFAWTENVGWINWQHGSPNQGDGVLVTTTYLAGFIWTENTGWINLGGIPPGDDTHYANDPADSTTFGVNVDPATGDLFGLAWGENIGWINFDTRGALGSHDQQARLDFCANRLRGFAWGENIGWINLNGPLHFIALGPTCMPGDAACDSIIALVDYAVLISRFKGPGVVVDCPSFDADNDGDVDLLDFATQQAIMSD